MRWPVSGLSLEGASRWPVAGCRVSRGRAAHGSGESLHPHRAAVPLPCARGEWIDAQGRAARSLSTACPDTSERPPAPLGQVVPSSSLGNGPGPRQPTYGPGGPEDGPVPPSYRASHSRPSLPHSEQGSPFGPPRPSLPPSLPTLSPPAIRTRTCTPDASGPRGAPCVRHSRALDTGGPPARRRG